jgi:hypothetical protein
MQVGGLHDPVPVAGAIFTPCLGQPYGEVSASDITLTPVSTMGVESHVDFRMGLVGASSIRSNLVDLGDSDDIVAGVVVEILLVVVKDPSRNPPVVVIVAAKCYDSLNRARRSYIPCVWITSEYHRHSLTIMAVAHTGNIVVYVVKTLYEIRHSCLSSQCEATT